MAEDPLVEWPVDKWVELQDVFKADWPRGIGGYTTLECQRKWLKNGVDYGFKVYCPLGNVRNGMVAINDKKPLYEVIIQCPADDTDSLAAALATTKLINWKTDIIVPFAPFNVIDCVMGILQEVNMEMKKLLPSKSFYLDKNTATFGDVGLPEGITFGVLSEDHTDMIDYTWPLKYPGSRWYFELIIKMGTGYGLFHQGKLISWMLINEVGALFHIFTLREHRRKGYAELLLKLVCNVRLEENNYVLTYSFADNVKAINLYRKVGFIQYECCTNWCFLRSKNN